ncbi:helix-turn-helix transcriptional regulator [Cryptosporangium arvum]|uniref:helix-turn-helix transcriptional regulator n=1 Tax=Cryptosporangium arvum TaxID=80871 RepID=UPI0004AF123F|nr:AAA family ATPase [Cryptosporangium arvum]
MTSAEPAPLVGRDAELATLRGLLGGTASGGASAAVVSGEAGIGKTRLLREFARAADAEGALVLVGHCVSFGGDAVPFLPISEAFGRLARDEPETVERLRVHYPPLARLLPQRRMVGSDGDEGRLDPAVLYEAVLGALFELASDRRVLLVLEDLHWADGATRELFGFLLTRLSAEAAAPVVPVASYRSDDLHRRHPLRTVVLEWGRLPGVLRVALRPLERADAAALVRGLAEGSATELDDAVLADVLDRAQGNAFYAEQLIAELVASPSSSVMIPRDLADLLLIRLERLSADTRHVLQLIAVAGLKIHHDRLVRVAGLSSAALNAALREAADAHVLDLRPGDKYAFRHALLAEAVYDDLLPGERRRHHAQFAEVIASLEIPGTDADLARHAREAGDLTTAFDAGIRAGDEAMRVAAPGEAMRLYESVQELASLVEDPRTVVELPRKAASAASHAGYPFRAVHMIEEALGRLPADAAPDVRAALLIELSEHTVAFDTSHDVVGLARQALELIPEEPPTALRARALAALARALSANASDIDEAIVYSDEARAIAVRVGITNVQADAATTRARIERWRADPAAAERLLRDSIVQARASGDPNATLRSLYSLAIFLYEQGRLEDARLAFGETAGVAREIGRPWATYGADALPMMIQADYVLGRWDDALSVAAAYPDAPALARAGLVAASLTVHAGRGSADVLRLAESNRPWWRRDGVLCIIGGAALLDAYADRGDVEAALATHDEIIDTVSTQWGGRWFDARFRLHALALGALASSVARAGAAERAAAVRRGAELVSMVGRVAESVRARSGRLGPDEPTRMTRADDDWPRLRWAPPHGGGPLGPESTAWVVRVAAEWARLRWAAASDPAASDPAAPDPAAPDPAAPDLAESGPAASDPAAVDLAAVDLAAVGPAGGEVSATAAIPSGGSPPTAVSSAAVSSAAVSSAEALSAEVPSAEELVAVWRRSVEAFGYGHRFEGARSRARLAAALLATGDPGSARAEAAAARSTARELGAEPLLAELAALAGPAGPRTAADRRDTELTPRERQVLELLALGRTNRQIGRSLYISDKTVSVHVSNLMAKLGAAGRTEAAALARRAGLLT